MSAVPFLQTRDLAVGYRARRASCTVLEGLDLTARVGELVCLLGSNGTGKSTLLRTLVRLQPALRGAIALGGVDLTSMTEAGLARRTGVLLTGRVLVDRLSARRVVELGRYVHTNALGGLTDHDRHAVARAMEDIGAAHLADRDFSRLSDGEQQRVMIARALAQAPRLLVLDEPTAFLDVAARVELWELLRRLTNHRGLAVIVSTHDVDLALRMADVVWLTLPGGRLVTGTPEEVVQAGAVEAAFNMEGQGMRSISTTRGDGGETSLAGGVRVSKASARVETYGTVDELNSSLGFARSICEDADIAALTKAIQQDLFRIGSSLATPGESPKPQVVIEQALVDRLTAEVHRLEAIEGVLGDWSIAGEHTAAAAYEVARTVCRRAERALVALQEAGTLVQPAILAYVNRLSDLLWLFGRKLEHDAGVSGSLRAVTGKSGNRFSRAW